MAANKIFQAMSFKIDHCVPSDAPAVAEAYISTYERMPRHIATFAGIPRDRQISNFTKKFEAGIESQNHPTATQEKHYLKATDPVTGELVAFATWIYLPQGYKAEEDPDATVTEIPEGANEALVRDLGPLAGNIRGEHEGRKGPHWCKYPWYIIDLAKLFTSLECRNFHESI